MSGAAVNCDVEAKMAQVEFTGRVLPDFIVISLPRLPDVEFDLEAGRPAKISMIVHDTNVFVTCTAEPISNDDVSELLVRSLGFVQAAVNLVGFQHGTNLTVTLELIQFEGRMQNVLMRDHDLASACTALDMDASKFAKAFTLIIEDQQWVKALDDLRMVVAFPDYAPIGCARAVEGVRHMISPGLGQSASWAALRETLNVDEAYVLLVTSNSVQPRHGNRVRVEGDVNSTIARRAWTIMDRYFSYRLRGDGKPLPTREFPILVG